MVTYCCNKCNKVFNRKSNYDYHINKKKPCKNNEPNDPNNSQCEPKNNDDIINTNLYQNIPIHTTQLPHNTTQLPQIITLIAQNNDLQQTVLIKVKNRCIYCKKEFSRLDSLNRHISEYCKIKINQDNQKEDLLQKLVKEMAEIKEDMKRKDEEISKLKLENKIYVQKIGKQQNNNTNIENFNVNINKAGHQENFFT